MAPSDKIKQPINAVVIVGPGRLGRSAFQILTDKGWSVQLIGRNQTIPKGPLTWLTVPDRAIEQAGRNVPMGGVVLHASGATDVSVLRPHPCAGSLHPLMTFPGPEHGLPSGEIPAAIAGDADAREPATRLAMALGFTPFDVPGDRHLYHASAVMAGNFATALLAESARVLVAAGVPADQAAARLAPLALASLANAVKVGPSAALTGPVSRGDDEIIQNHLDALQTLPKSTRQTYEALLESARWLAQNSTSE